MIELIKSVPANIFETMGTCAGLIACFFIVIQVVKEFKCKEPSSLSLVYVIGWLVVFTFWIFYGIRFDVKAIIISNIIATFLQGMLLYAILRKNNKRRNK